MGCYGIGVTRIVAAAIEQNYDERASSGRVRSRRSTVADARSTTRSPSGQVRKPPSGSTPSCAPGIDVLLDDRDERPGVMLADWELIGIPHRLVVGERGLKEGIRRIPGAARRRCGRGSARLPLRDAVELVRRGQRRARAGHARSPCKLLWLLAATRLHAADR